MRIGKTYCFEAAHHLPGHKGKCAEPHGHSYRLEVEVESDELIDFDEASDGGMVMDFGDLDEIVESVVAALDHTDLNISTPAILGLDVKRTTAELLCLGIVGRIEKTMSLRAEDVRLSRVRLYETEKCYAEWAS